MSVEEILRPIIEQEFAKYEQDGCKIKLPSVTRDRIKYTICCLLGTLLNFPIALVFYIILMSRTTRVKTIIRLAKKSPDKPIEQIISEEMNSQGSKGPVISMIAVIACVLMILFVGYNFVLGMMERYLEPDNAVTSEWIADGDWDEEQNNVIERSEENTYVAYGEGYKLVSCGLQYMNEENIVIPDRYEGLDVVAIGDDAFSGFATMQSVEIPHTIKEIGKRAFQDCYALRSVSIPEGVEIIQGGAFMNCEQLVEVSFGSTVNAIEGECFKGCSSLECIEIPVMVTEIRGNCFEDCVSLSEVILHDNIIAIHGYAFRNCYSLEKIVIPPRITEIRGNTFENCSALERIYIPKGVVRIGGHAFRGCDSLYEVSVPDTVTEIGSSAFRECDNLQEIEVPQNAKVNERAFKDSPTNVVYK